ncbi:phosphotransferase [bacterium]|nr:phosphotransferase [bacterium]
MSAPAEFLDVFYPTLKERGQPAFVTAATPGFSGARVHRVAIESAAYCVRQWPVGASGERLLAIHRLLSHVEQSSQVPIAVPLLSADGRTVTEYQGRLWQVEPWLPGTADFDDSPTESRLHAAMSGLAAWHRVAALFAPSARETNWLSPVHEDVSPTVSSRLRRFAQWRVDLPATERRLLLDADPQFRSLGQKLTTLFRLLSDSIGRELQQVASLPVRQQPCIRDIWHDHLLFSDDRLTGIVDFGAVKTDSVACDLSRLLGSLFGDSAADWQRALDAYEQQRPLTTAEHQLLRPLNRSGLLLSGMSWLQRRADQQIDAEQMPRVIARLGRIVSQLALF